jgi:feruloyl esterase
MGGGGYDGSLVTGLTVYSNPAADGGDAAQAGIRHCRQQRRPQRRPGFDGRFGLDDEALANYGKQSVKKAHDVAVAIVKKAYGRAPSRVLLRRRLAGGTRSARCRGRATRRITTASSRITRLTT